MEKEQEQKPLNEDDSSDVRVKNNKVENQTEVKSEPVDKEDIKEITPEEKIKELEDKLARTF